MRIPVAAALPAGTTAALYRTSGGMESVITVVSATDRGLLFVNYNAAGAPLMFVPWGRIESLTDVEVPE